MTQQQPDRQDADSDHETDKAELEKRDRAQPGLATDQANLRPDGDAKPDKQERRAAIDSLRPSQGSIADQQRDEVADEAAED